MLPKEFASQLSTNSNEHLSEISQSATVPPQMLIAALWKSLSILGNWVWTSERGGTLPLPMQ